MKPKLKNSGKRSIKTAPPPRQLDKGRQTIAASVPSSLVRRVREQIGPREFSQFVSRSMERELVRLNREQFVADFVREIGPLDQDAVEAARRLIRG
jgi:hypothetical protein